MGFDWAGSQWAIESDTIEGLLGSMVRLTSRAEGRRYVWRGQSRSDWTLSSALWRAISDRPDSGGDTHVEELLQQYERGVHQRALLWPTLDLHGLLTHQDILARLQHHGVPTSLLDVTRNPWIACWFAVQSLRNGSADEPDAVVFAFDVTEWQTLNTDPGFGIPTYAHVMDPLAEDYLALLASGKPFTIRPTRPTGRLMAQQGEFIRAQQHQPRDGFALDLGQQGEPEALPGDFVTEPIPSSLSDPPRFAAFIIRHHLRGQLEKSLINSLGIDRSALFPDLGGLADHFAERGLDGFLDDGIRLT